MTPGDLPEGRSVVLTPFAAAGPALLPMVSRNSGHNHVILGARERQYGLVEEDVPPRTAKMCSRVIDGGPPTPNADTADVRSLLEGAADLRLDAGAWITLPVPNADDELHGTVCVEEPHRHERPLAEELGHIRGADQVLPLLLEQHQPCHEAGRCIHTAALVVGLNGLEDAFDLLGHGAADAVLRARGRACVVARPRACARTHRRRPMC